MGKLLRAVKYVGVGLSAATVYGAGVLIWNHEISPKQPQIVYGVGKVNPGRGQLSTLKLHQFGSCPFCCKVRTYLDYYGFTYEVDEVDPMYKWRSHKGMKMPTLRLIHNNQNNNNEQKQDVCINDSSVIISVLQTYLINNKLTDIDSQILTCYPELFDEKKKKNIRLNKYHIMYGSQEHEDARKEEGKWRQWADDHLVHMISPNVYRSFPESLRTFMYFAERGQWDRLYGGVTGAGVKYAEIFLGSVAMYSLAKVLKKKYKLKDDVRESLYDACNEWHQAVGKDRRFLGGDLPNLADLAVYGVLRSFEGCEAFSDVLQHTEIGPWYGEMKSSVVTHRGHATLTGQL